MRKLVVVLVILLVIVGVVAFLGRRQPDKPVSGKVQDEATLANVTAEQLAGSDEDYYADMDYGVTRNPEAVRAELVKYLPGITAAEAVKHVVRGRNNWIVWTAGNDRLWDILSTSSFGNLDFLKTISNHPKLQFGRHNRWTYLGLVNEPCYRKGTGPRADRFGLWLDERVAGAGCGPDPFENETKYPGVKYGARGKNIPAGSYYGYGTGIVGLRLFPNPAFDDKAQKAWDPVRYYTDPGYYQDKNLVKPYRVGMSCGFCHVGPNPTNPPADPENPTWANLNSNPGAQYFWIERIFMYDQNPKDFVWQLFHTSRPGALDTSLVSSDQINNPRTMNAIYNLEARLEIGRRWGHEKLAGGSLDNKHLNDYVPPGTPLTRYYDPATNVVGTTHVLKDGADSVGALGALNRVYLNIGLFSEEWLLHFTPLLGGADITPIRIADAEKNSAYWRANTAQTPDLALFFLATAKPDYLQNAPGGAAYLAADAAKVTRGKEVFANHCARCHSSKLPEQTFANHFKPGCIGPDYMKCWNAYWAHTKTPEFRAQMTQIVMAPDFLANNYLSNEVRVPVTLLETNACSPLATNAVRGNIWDNFSSESYKELPSVGKVMVHHPYSGKPSWYEMPGGGRGFTRPASLISLWSTAPYLQNNTVGVFEESGSVPGRMHSFEDGITKMLWPEKRDGNGMFMTVSGKPAPGWIDKTTVRNTIKIAPGYLPRKLARLAGPLAWLLPNFFGQGGVEVGPIPAGTPINLLTNIDLKYLSDTSLRQRLDVLDLLLDVKEELRDLPDDATDAQASKVLEPLLPKLLAASKCTDFVINRGHYFGTSYLPASEGETPLGDDDKHALIAFLKTF